MVINRLFVVLSRELGEVLGGILFEVGRLLIVVLGRVLAILANREVGAVDRCERGDATLDSEHADARRGESGAESTS